MSFGPRFNEERQTVLRRRGGHRLTYGARVEKEVRRALREAKVSVERKINGRRGIGWIAYVGSGEMSKKEKDECRVRWREFTQSGKVVEVVPKQRRARRAPVGPAPMEMEMPIAPDGVPAFMNPQFCNFIDLAAD